MEKLHPSLPIVFASEILTDIVERLRDATICRPDTMRIQTKTFLNQHQAGVSLYSNDASRLLPFLDTLGLIIAEPSYGALWSCNFLLKSNVGIFIIRSST